MELQGHLSHTLPQYMIPGDFVFLQVLPLTPSGKVDRKRLPVPDRARPSTAVAPRTPTEEMLIGGFREVLGYTDFGVFDDFFDLGGNSLMAARLISKLRAASGLDLPLRNLFERPTVAALAEAIDALAWAASSGQSRKRSCERVEIEL